MNNWFNGRTKPDIDTALAIARALSVPLDWLADDSAEFPPPSQKTPEDERILIALARRIGIDEALARIATPQKPGVSTTVEPPFVPESVDHGYGKWGTQRDETEAQLRRDQERREPKRPGKKDAKKDAPKK